MTHSTYRKTVRFKLWRLAVKARWLPLPVRAVVADKIASAFR
jgi:hypothetical protein